MRAPFETSASIAKRAHAWAEAGLIGHDQIAPIIEFERGAEVRDGRHALASEGGAGATSVTRTSEATPGPVLRDRLSGSLGLLGALLVGLGVLLTVAANWDSVGDAAKVVTIIAAMLVAYAVALRADVRGGPRWVGTSAYVVAMMVFAGGVFLLGQMFNVQAHDPLGFLVVAVTASAVTVLTTRRPVGWIAAAAWLAWAVHEMAMSLADASTDGAALALAGAGMLFAIAVLGAGWTLDGVAERVQRDHVGQGASARPVAADLDTLGGPFRSVALVGLFATLVPASFAWRAGGDDIVTGEPVAAQLLVAGAVALAGAGLAWRLGSTHLRGWVAIALGLAAGAVLLGAFTQNATVVAVLANLLLAAGGLGLAALGLVADRRSEYAWGVTWLVALIVARYVDVMVSVALGGLAFIGAGAALLGCAWLVGRSRHVWRERAAS